MDFLGLEGKRSVKKTKSESSVAPWCTILLICLQTHEATVYGKRDACIHGLAVMHRDRLNLFKNSDGWRHAVIRDCSMLPRGQMYKPEATWNAHKVAFLSLLS